MSKPIVARKNASDLIRLLLIPALGLVLLAVVCWPTAKKNNSASGQKSQAAVEMAAAPSESNAKRPIWPSIQMDDVIACNPFQPLLTQSFAAPAERHSETNAESHASTDHEATGVPISPGTLQAIYFDARGAAAILDSRVVRIGDILANGSRVVGINAQGVSLDRLE